MTGRSHRPFWQWVLDQEHLHIAMLRRTLHELPPLAFRELRVDSILLQAGLKEHKDIREKITNLTWKELADREQCVFQAPWPSNDSEERIFRAEVISHESKTTLDFDPPLPNSSGKQPEPISWWKDMTDQEARAAIQRGESLMLCEIGGVGKTILTKLRAGRSAEREWRSSVVAMSQQNLFQDRRRTNSLFQHSGRLGQELWSLKKPVRCRTTFGASSWA